METEKKYLENYNIKKYQQVSLSTDICVFALRKSASENYRKNDEIKLSVLLVKRGVHPFKDKWALPGGFLHADETIEECAIRETKEETGIVPSCVIPFKTYSDLDRDPRGHIISAAHISILKDRDVAATGNTDAADAQWFTISLKQNENEYQLSLENENIHLNARLKKARDNICETKFTIIEDDSLAFDHAKILAEAIEYLRSHITDYTLCFEFLPEKFTLTELQEVHEAILDTKLLSANFRRKSAQYIKETETIKTGAGHRPAQLFTKNKEEKL